MSKKQMNIGALIIVIIVLLKSLYFGPKTLFDWGWIFVFLVLFFILLWEIVKDKP